MLHGFLGFHVLGEHHQSGSVAVETVYDEQHGTRIFLFQIVAQDAVGGSVLDVVGRNGENSAAFVDDNDVVVLIDEFDARMRENNKRAGEVHFQQVALAYRRVEL